MSISPWRFFARRHAGCVVLALLAGRLAAADLALRISNETAPAGGWAQLKVSAVTPQLVGSGRIVMKFDPAVFGPIADIGVFSAEGDAVGVATVNGQSLDVTFSSRLGGMGQLAHLPVLTVTVPVLSAAAEGTVSAIALDTGLARFTDLQNNVYAVTVAPGSVTVGGSLSVQSVTPGGGLVPAGAVVRVHGSGFSAATTVTIDGVSIAGVSLSRVQPTGVQELDVTLGGAADLAGKRVTLRNPDGAQVEYFSSLSANPDDPVPARFGNIRPLLSMQTSTSASMTFTIRGGGVAIHNPNATPVDVILEQQNPFTPEDPQSTVTVPPGALRIYSPATSGASGFFVFAAQPVHMLGLGFPAPNGTVFASVPFPTVAPLHQLTVDPAAIAFQWQIGSATPATVPVFVRPAASNYSFAYTVSAPPAPFSVTPAQAVSPAGITVAVNPAGLAAGTYTGSVVLTPKGPNAVPTTIPLSLKVSALPLVVPSAEKFTFVGPDEYSQLLKVASNGSPVAFTVAASDGAGPHWLTVTPSGATTPGNLSVAVNSKGLAAGDYSGQVVITGPNNSVTVPVQLNVSVSNIFGLSPASAVFSVQTGSAIPPTQTVLVSGPSTGAMFSVATSSGGNWLSVITTPTGQLGAVITANPTGLKAGIYRGTVTLTSPASALPASFPVTLAIWDKAPVLTVSPNQINYTITLGENPNVPSPQTIRVESGDVPLNFTANFPEVPASGGLLATPTSVPAPSTGIGVLGTNSYNITMSGGGQNVVVPVTTVTTTGPLTPPFLGAVVNAASQTAGPISPGEILTIYGFGAGPSNPAGFTLDASGKVAAGLNGAQVLFDGKAAPMIYGSATQANVMVPYEVYGHATTTIALKFGDLTSAAWTIPVAGSAPGIFTLGSTGLGTGAVLNEDNSINGAANAAARGSIVQIFATGEGQTSPAGVTGSVTGRDLKMPLGSVKVTIGGQDAAVQYAGSAANAVAGLFQVNAVVPQGLVAGQVAIRISVGGVDSQDGVTIAVK